jgi:IclR family pca regulon transcriptional regulator
MTTSPEYYSKTIDKGMRILEAFDQTQSEMSLKELSKITNINLTSTYRFVNTFEKLGYLSRDNRKRLLKLGPKAIALGNRFLSGFELSKIINPCLDEIHEKYNITVDASLFHEDTLVVIYRREAKNALTFHPPIMRKSLYFTALGKSILAFLPHDQIKQILGRQAFEKMTKKTLAGKTELTVDLEKTRKRGYSLNNEEYINGLISIGAPLFNLHNNRVVGSISFDSTTIQQSLRAFEKKYAKIILATAKDISALIQAFV